MEERINRSVEPEIRRACLSERFGMEVKMKNRGWGTAGTVIAALLLYEIGKLAGSLAARALLPASGEGGRALLMHLVGGGLVYLVWRKELCAGKGRPVGKTGLRIPGLRREGLWGEGIRLFLLSVSSALGLNLLLALTRLTIWSGSFQETAAAQAAVPVWIGILLYGLAAPFSEEMLFRGIVYRKAEEAFGGDTAGDTAEQAGAVRARRTAAVVSSLVFGIYHGNPVQGIYAFLIGLLLCLVYERTGRLTAAVLFHGAGNLAVYLLIDVAGIGEYLSVGAAVCLCALLLAAAALCLKPYFALRKKEEVC